MSIDRNRSLRDDLYVPGIWECPTCGFTLSRNYIYATNGTVGVNDEDLQEPCPNDGTAMMRQSWKRYAAGLEKMVTQDRDDLRKAILELRVTIDLCRFCGGKGEQGDPDIATWECSWCAPARKIAACYPEWMPTAEELNS